MPSWIDFKELRSKLKFEEVLEHYGVDGKRRGLQLTSLCPLPSHPPDRKAPSFSANLEKGIFQCFICKAKGNVLDFAVLMAGESADDGRALKRVALELRARFCPDNVKRSEKDGPGARVEEPAPNQLEMDAVVNAPLDFELQGLDGTHAYLTNIGLVSETINQFGLGYCARGLLKGRIAIPLHDAKGALVGYAGRVVDDKAITDANPKYLFPTKRERNGKPVEFRRELFLYNGSRLKTLCESLIVVQGFSSVWWLTQNGFGRVVATMGPTCSDEQLRLILSTVASTGRILIIPNGDEEGLKLAQTLLLAVSPHRFVQWVKLGEGEQPPDLSTQELKECLG